MRTINKDLPILKALSKARIIQVELNNDKTMLIITEMCDEYFYVGLTKYECMQMVDELNKLIKKMNG